jgi:hypothetical protein
LLVIVVLLSFADLLASSRLRVSLLPKQGDVSREDAKGERRGEGAGTRWGRGVMIMAFMYNISMCSSTYMITKRGLELL